MLKVDVTSSRGLTAMVRGLKVMGPEFTRAFRLEAKQVLEPGWKQALYATRPNRLQRHVLVDTSRVTISDRSIRLKSGGVGKLRKGDSNASIARAVEFGQAASWKSRYKRRNETKPGTHTVTRRTAVPVSPRAPKGKVVYKALESFVPEAADAAVRSFFLVFDRVTRG